MHSGNFKVEKITLIVAAAGVGKRMGLGYPKQFLTWDGKPLFIYPLLVAQNSNSVEKIIVVTGKESIETVKEFCEEFKIDKVIEVVEGGKERQDSIGRALKYCKEEEIIAVQDGVRPFLKEKYFTSALELLSKDKEVAGVVVGVPVKDTIKIIDGENGISSTPDRATLFAAHTPQIFRGEVLKKAYERAEEEKFLGTDDSSLVERLGEKVKIFIGDYDNIKVTTQEDLKFLK